MSDDDFRVLYGFADVPDHVWYALLEMAQWIDGEWSWHARAGFTAVQTLILERTGFKGPVLHQCPSSRP